MSLPRKGIRKVKWKNASFEWTIRKKPTPMQGSYETAMILAVQSVNKTNRSILIADLGVSRPDNWIHPYQTLECCIKEILDGVPEANCTMLRALDAMRIFPLTSLLFMVLLFAPIMTSASRPIWKRCEAASLDVEQLEKLLWRYRKEFNALPSTNEGLKLLVHAGYLEFVPQDPWGREYIYSYEEERGFVVATLGEDGVWDGEGLNADYTNNSNSEQYISECKNNGWWFW